MGILDSIFGGQYTLGELMRIDSGRQQRAASCKVELTDTFHELKKQGILDKFKSLFLTRSTINVYYVIFKFKVTSDSGTSNTVFIRTNPDFNLVDWDKNKVEVFCSCQDFKYRSAYILNRRHSVLLTDKTKLALGQALTEAPKNKSKTTLLCKHAFAATNWLVNNYSNVMKTI